MIGLVGVGFVGGLFVLAVASLIAGSRRRHVKHHSGRSFIGCDWCMKRDGLLP